MNPIQYLFLHTPTHTESTHVRMCECTPIKYAKTFFSVYIMWLVCMFQDWLPLLPLGTIKEEGLERFSKSKDQEVCCKSTSPSNVRNCTHTILPTWLFKLELNKNHQNKHGNKGGEKCTTPQYYIRFEVSSRTVREGKRSSPRKGLPIAIHTKWSNLKVYCYSLLLDNV